MRTFRHLLFPMFVFVILDIYAIESDSLVRWNEISFSSPFERTSFHVFLKDGKKEYLRLFLANSTTGDEDLERFENKIEQTLREINTSDAIRKKNDKKIKYIYQLVHDRFLSKYQEENRFYEIIKNGNYNCVTATALYALFFEKLGIPYTIKEEPTHVYLVAYPNQENIMIETTTPASGFFSFDPAFKTTYINTLKSQKIIGATEAQASNVDQLFNQYYFGKENINLTQLIGIHFINDGLFKRDHDDIEGAYQQIKKGYLYYPNTRSEFLLMSFTAAKLEEANLSPLTRAALVGQLARFRKVGITSEVIQGEFYNLTQSVLLKNNDKELYQQVRLKLISNITDPELLNEINYIFYYENGRVLYNQGNFLKAKPFFAQAMALQPNNVDLGGVFVSCVAQSLRNERNNKAILDSLEHYKSKFPSLKDNKNFTGVLSSAYAIEFGNSFVKGDVTRGEKYQKLFEEMYTLEKNILSPDIIGKAYSEASIYYFKKGQKAKAKQLIDRGLEIVPEDYQLKMRKQMINNGH